MMKRLLFISCTVALFALSGAPWAQASVTLNSTNFPDANFRAALTAATGVAEGGTINEATLTELDVSNRGITNITGVEKLTALTKFVAAGNDIQYARFTGNTHLEWLDLSNNADLLGFNSSTATASNHYINLTPNSTPMPLKHLDLSNCNIGYFQAISGTYGVTTLTWLSLANDTRMAGWSSGITAQTGLVYCDLTNTGQTSTSIGFTSAHSSLETLILSNNSSFGYSSSFQYLSGLKHLDISGCDLYFREGTSSQYYLLHYLTPTNNPNLETLNASASNMGSNTEGLTGFQHLKTVNISGNSGATHFWIINCPNIESLNITGCSGLTNLNLEEDELPHSNFSLTAGSNTSLTTVSLNKNNYGSVADAMSDLNGLTAVHYLYLEENTGFDNAEYTLATADCGNLYGLDLGRNNFKSFTASDLPSAFTTLLLGNSPTLESVEIHNAQGLKKIGTTNGLGNANGEGLYLLNDPLLTHLDLDNIYSSFNAGSVNQLTTLNYLDLGSTGQATNGINYQGMTNLETLILNGNTSFGYSSSFQYLSALKYLDISNCDIYFREGGGPDDYYLLHYLTPANNPNLETLLASNSKLGTKTEGLTGFTNLKTVDVSNNVTSGTVNMTQFWVNGSPNLESLDIRGNSALTYLQLNNDDLPRNNFTLLVDDDCSALNSLYLNGNNYGSVGQATQDFANIGNLEFLYMENNSGFTGGPLTMSAADCGDLKGIDLGNNGFTSFTAESLPQSLTALMLGDNPSMERLEMHNNPGIKTMTASPVMSDGSGLYLLGNTALTYMDISGTAEQPNYFQRIGNNGSLNGVPIETLKASYNKFYTFRNLTTVAGGIYERWNKNSGVYDFSSTRPSLQYYYYAYWPTSAAQPDSASLEQLTGLKYLDLSHCNLKDSVYLHKNTELRYLDVSHNRSIERHTTSQDKGAGIRNWIDNGNTSTSYPDYKKYLWVIETTPKYPGRQETYDQEYYTMDYNDTTGLYILDLLDNNKLEYLNISYTGIQQTALTHCHVSNARFIWIQDLPELKYFYADYNGMRSMGIGSQNGKKKTNGEILTPGLKSLERLSAIGMRGADVTTMQGSINFTLDTRCKNLHYINLSYSDYDSIGVYASKIDTIILTGNPIHKLNVQTVDSITYIDASKCAFKHRGYDPETGITVGIPSTVRQRYSYTDYNTGVTETLEKTITMNGARSNGTYTGTVTSPFSGLRYVYAFNRPKLTTVLLDNCNGLREVYCHDDSILPCISGFDNLAYPLPDVDSQQGFGIDKDSLQIVHVHNNPEFIDLNLTKNDTLLCLFAYNDKKLGPALGEKGLDLNASKYLRTAWVSNSLLEKFTEDAGEHLDTLFIWQNPMLDSLNVTDNPGLRYFDLRNCMVRDLDMSNNSRLIYFDCSNQDSIWTNYDHFNFEMPGEVPTVVNDPGKNSIADLHFGSKVLQVVHADNNDLYCMDGLNNNPNLQTLTYSYNHINGIDLSGCPNITNYNCHHNVRGLIPGELATWSTTENGVTTIHELYYLQLKPNAGDGIDGNDTFLGNKCGQDSLLSDQVDAYQRRLIDDGFDPDKVIEFTVNSSGPHIGTRGQNSASGAPMRADMVEPGTTLDPESFYGKIAIIKRYDRVRNYVYYTYDDGRPNSSSRGGSGFGLAWGPPPGATDVRETTADGMGELTVVSERYYDAAGAEHSEPIDGVNIIVRQMSDGSTQTVKIIR